MELNCIDSNSLRLFEELKKMTSLEKLRIKEMVEYNKNMQKNNKNTYKVPEKW